MATVEDNIVAYDAIRQELEARHMGEWALLHELELIGVYDSFEQAAEQAVQQFGKGPYLIRQIGAPPLVLPASVMYRPEYGAR